MKYGKENHCIWFSAINQNVARILSFLVINTFKNFFLKGLFTIIYVSIEDFLLDSCIQKPLKCTYFLTPVMNLSVM